MIAWVNFAGLVVSAGMVLVLYLVSVRPAAMERKIGAAAYRRCTVYRIVAGVFMVIATAGYVLYAFYPVPIGLPETFPWSWWISAAIAAVLGLPGGYLFGRGMWDAGEETMRPRKDHALYGGIYERMRHPQTVGGLALWWALSLLLHSPFLVLFTLVWVPIYLVVVRAEDRDLARRYGAAYEEYRKLTGWLWPRRKKT